MSSRASLLLQPSETLSSSSTGLDAASSEEDFPRHIYKLLEKNGNRLLVSYSLLSSVSLKAKVEDEAGDRGQHAFLREIFALVADQQSNYHIIQFLDSLAGLALKTRQDSLLRHSCTLLALLNGTSWPPQDLWHQYKPLNILNMVVSIQVASLPLEDHLYVSWYARDSSLSQDLTTFGLSMDGTLASYSSALECLKSKVCSDDYSEEGLENHEEQSTTSGSSRTSHYMTVVHSNAGEADLQSIDNPVLDFLDNGKVMPDIMGNQNDLPQEISEYYDGCFFGDLEIEFSGSDRFLFEEETYARRFSGGYNHHGKYPYNSYNKYNTSSYRSPPYGAKPNYQQKRFEGSQPEHNDGYRVTYEPKKSPQPDSDYKIIPIPLFTIPTTGGNTSFNLNIFNPGNLNIQGPVEPTNGRQMVHEIIPQILPKPLNADKEKQQDHKNVKDKVHEPHAGSHYHKGKKIGKDKASSPSNQQAAKKVKVQEKQCPVAETKGRKNGNAKDKGEIKLWDMISIKGKLADCHGKKKS